MKSRVTSFALALSVASLSGCGDRGTANRNANAPSGSGSGNPGSSGATGSGSGSSTSGSAASGGVTSGSAGSGASTSGGSGAGTATGGSGPCGLSQAAFCDAFDAPSPGGRAGDLDDAQWSAARIATLNNPGQGLFNYWPQSIASACGQTMNGVQPDHDMFFCAGGPTSSMHFNNAYDDAGGFVIHSYRIRRPFDFANRTGIVAFDVGAKAQIPTGHGWWFEVFFADEPIPAPYQNGGAIALFARAGFGLEFQGSAVTCMDYSGAENAISSIFVEQNYAITHTYQTEIMGKHCFKTAEEVLNHFELHISQNRIEVFASDAGDPSSLRSVGYLNNISLPMTRGYVSFQHSHYNASKSGQLVGGYTTYHWDNIGFDGPVLSTPRAYEVPDNLNSKLQGVNTGYLLGTSGMVASGSSPMGAVSLAGVDLTGATDAVLSLNAWFFQSGDNITYRFNGGTWRTFAHPFPTSDAGARGVVIPVQLGDLVNGTNTLEMKSGSGNVIVANAELIVNIP